MFCKKCGREIGNGQKYCVDCDTSFGSSRRIGKIITTIIIIVIIGGIGVYNSMDEEAVEMNEKAVESFDSGDSTGAIGQLKKSLSSATTDESKIEILKNLSYVYSSEGQNSLALKSFKEALGYADKDPFNYFLISGEIALLEGKPGIAQSNYNKAYQLDPNNFQINNALNLFYLDIEGIAPRYTNYSKALEYAQKAFNLSDSEIKNTATENLAIAYLFNENYDKAISLFSSLDISGYPYRAFWLGLAYMGAGNITKAELYLNQAENAGIEMPQEVYDVINNY